MNKLRRSIATNFGLEAFDEEPLNISDAVALPPAPIDEAQAVTETASLLDAITDARDAKDVVDDINEVSVGMEKIRDTLDYFNAKGGVSQEGLVFATLALESFTERLGVGLPDLKVNLRGYNEDILKQTVSLEELDELSSVVNRNSAALNEQSLDASVQLGTALKDALPAALARLESVLDRAAEVEGNPRSGNVKSDDFAHLLTVDNSIPEDMPGYFAQYGRLGESVVDGFNAAAHSAASAAAELGNADFSSADAFHESVGKVVTAVTDPRATIDENDAGLALPGTGPLFASDASTFDGEEAGQSSDNPTVKALADYTSRYSPVDPSDVQVGESAPIAEVRPLTPDEILSIGESLTAVFARAQMDGVEDTGRACWSGVCNASDSFASKFDAADESVQSQVADTADQVGEYLDTTQTMAQWTPMWYLSNLVQTTNAFVLYAERSLEGDAAVSQESHALTGALIGTAIAGPIGAGVGYLVGRSKDKKEAAEAAKKRAGKPAVSQEGVIGALTGATAGIATGTLLAGPWGAVVGASYGAAAGHHAEEHDKLKKQLEKAKAEARRKKRADTAAKPKVSTEDDDSTTPPSGDAAADNAPVASTEDNNDNPTTSGAAPTAVAASAHGKKEEDAVGDLTAEPNALDPPAVVNPPAVNSAVNDESQKAVVADAPDTAAVVGGEIPVVRSADGDILPVTDPDKTVSLEGGGIKLRPGMKVRYSKGYGKIIKVFDRPVKYKGEIHHCSKDNPKYEVKSDMGNHLSLHKASALTVL
jgi:hypothetical protein